VSPTGTAVTPVRRHSSEAPTEAAGAPSPHGRPEGGAHWLHWVVHVVAVVALVFLAHYAVTFVFAAEPPPTTLFHHVVVPPRGEGSLTRLTAALSSPRAQYLRPLVESLLFTTAGVLLARRRPGDPMLQLVVLVILLMGSNSATVATLTTVPTRAPSLPFRLLALGLYTLAPIVSLAVLATYPSGRPVPRWAPIYCAFGALPFLALAGVMFREHRFSNPLVLAGMAAVGVALAFPRHRYLHHATIRQRHQILWMAYGAGLFLVMEAVTLAILPPMLDPSRPSFPFLLILEEACLFGANIVPLTAMAFSAAEYRLWDVDRLIGRSLVYAVLTVLLAGAFGVAFFAVRGVLLALFGVGDVPGALAGGVFVVLAFVPVRRRVRAFLDRHFWGIGVDYEALARRAAAVAPLPVHGDTFASFASLSLLGRGGMGAVYAASHPELGSAIVLKVMSPEVANEPDMRARFHLEAEILEQMDHPNIIPFLARGENYLAMTHVAGRDLAARIAEGAMPLSEALPVLRDLASALDALHARRIVHRDVKPSNVLLADQRAMLLDFGAALRLDADGPPGDVVCTLAYASPEQIRGDAVDGRADVYALAVTAYEMLTGRRPFAELESEPLGLSLAQLRDPPPDPRTFVALPERLAAAVLRGMAKRREDRPEDCASFVAGLDADAASSPMLPA